MNCKEGDIAIIVKPFPTVEYSNLGTMVEVMKPDVVFSFITGQRYWRCLLMSGLTIFCCAEHGQKRFIPGEGVIVPDAVLKPLPKDAADHGEPITKDVEEAAWLTI